VTFAGSARVRIILLLSLIAAAVLLVTSIPHPAPAAPSRAAPGTTDPEGGSASLQKALASASRGWTDAKNRLATSRKRQAALVVEQRETDKRVATLTADVQSLAAAAYRGGRMSMFTAALDSGSMSNFVDKSELINQMSWKNSQQFTALTAAREDQARQKFAIENEIKIQQAQEKAMAKRKADAERALIAVGGTVSGGFSGGSARAARSAPRNANGGFSSQGCTLDDPTSGGCVTARMLNAYQQARAAGFTHYTHCWRTASFGEHPKGRACDFAADVGGFGGVATGASKTYGNRLANWAISNSDRIGVLYVIWFRQIWMPSTGWRAYNGGGDPSSNHENHVHISVQ
jgi:hypothetical protein